MDCYEEFWRLANSTTVLNETLIDKIWNRPRKRGVWCHHLYVLQRLIKDAEEGRLSTNTFCGKLYEEEIELETEKSR